MGKIAHPGNSPVFRTDEVRQTAVHRLGPVHLAEDDPLPHRLRQVHLAASESGDFGGLGFLGFRLQLRVTGLIGGGLGHHGESGWHIDVRGPPQERFLRRPEKPEDP